jgi:hypothetical protein
MKNIINLLLYKNLLHKLLLFHKIILDYEFIIFSCFFVGKFLLLEINSYFIKIQFG